MARLANLEITHDALRKLLGSRDRGLCVIDGAAGKGGVSPLREAGALWMRESQKEEIKVGARNY